jgi:hypothetical protein
MAGAGDETYGEGTNEKTPASGEGQYCLVRL